VVLTFSRLCELFEAESKKYLKKDKYPFVDRHLFRIDDTCVLGQMYKILFSKDFFINKVNIKAYTYFDFNKLIYIYIYIYMLMEKKKFS